MRNLLLAAAVFGLLASLAAVPTPPPPPYHAFCRTMWLFATPCTEVATKLVQQIQAFNPMSGCALCQYMLVSATPRSIKANHTSPSAPLGENITISLSPTVLTGGCRVTALSASLGFSSLLDDGLNYCNLYNLLSESGLNSAPGFMEMTNEWACLGYGLATCNK